MLGLYTMQKHIPSTFKNTKPDRTSIYLLPRSVGEPGQESGGWIGVSGGGVAVVLGANKLQLFSFMRI